MELLPPLSALPVRATVTRAMLLLVQLLSQHVILDLIVHRLERDVELLLTTL